MTTDAQGALRTQRHKPRLGHILKRVIRAAKVTKRTNVPARVLSYNPATQKADVELGAIIVLVTDDGERELAPTPILGVPVRWPRGGAGAFYDTLPLLPGDTGHVWVADRSLEQWLNGQGQAVDPGLNHVGNLVDAVFEPGLSPNSAPLPVTDLTARVIEGTLINLGRVATSFAVRGTEFVSAMTAYTTAVSSAGATWAGVVPPTAISNGAFIAALIAATATLAGSIPGWLSIKVRIE